MAKIIPWISYSAVIDALASNIEKSLLPSVGFLVWPATTVHQAPRAFRKNAGRSMPDFRADKTLLSCYDVFK